ncbi:MAG: adenosine kinase [Desulfobacterium sp.]|nr:adenosine kinase [Desulfobacterium sp.]
MSLQDVVPAGKKRIVGLGSALVDILIHESDSFLEKTGAAKGGMELVAEETIQAVLGRSKAERKIVPGGSACNTIIGVACLGGKGRFVGKCGQDEFGSLFVKGLKKNHVEPILFQSTSPTGRVLSIITQDAQRTMLTYLGASSETSPHEITSECFADSAIVHLEGYLLFNRDLMSTALQAAKKVGAAISLDLASFTVVEQSRDFLMRIVNDYVDILIANEDEAKAFTGFSNESRAISALSEKTKIAVLKIGKKGSFIADHGNIVKIEAQGAGAKVIDTTGAGDLWASGFLYGMVNGFSAEKCGQLASACGYEVCQVIGANIPEEGWQRIRSLMPE